MSSLVGFVSQSGGRGTLPLLHGCLSTMLLCTWSAMHLNVPADGERRRTILLRKTKWMVLAIFAPEAISILAMQEWFETRWLLKKIHETPLPQKEVMPPNDETYDTLRRSVDITDSHIEEKDTGEEDVGANYHDLEKDQVEVHRERLPSDTTGFSSDRTYVEADMTSDRDLEAMTYGSSRCSWKRIHAQYVNMGGFALGLEEGRRRLCAPQFLELLQRGFIELPQDLDEEISAKDKGDPFTKTWACIQITWLLVYLISRAVVRLPVTTLELFTVAVACCTFFTYCAWFEKPQDVECPTEVYLCRKDDDDGLHRILEDYGKRYCSSSKRISLVEYMGPAYTSVDLFELTYLLPLLSFGACHMLGWYFHFNSAAEMWLWRASSISCVVLPPAYLILSRLTKGHEWLTDALALIFVVIYIVSRIYLFIDMFAGLRRVPVGVYDDVGWSQWIPHIGG